MFTSSPVRRPPIALPAPRQEQFAFHGSRTKQRRATRGAEARPFAAGIARFGGLRASVGRCATARAMCAVRGSFGCTGGTPIRRRYTPPNWPAFQCAGRFKRVPFRDTSARSPLLARTRYDHLLAQRHRVLPGSRLPRWSRSRGLPTSPGRRPANRSILSSTSVRALWDGTRLTQRRSSRHRKVLPISTSGTAVKSRERPPDT
jgi:hypothetical protein